MYYLASQIKNLLIQECEEMLPFHKNNKLEVEANLEDIVKRIVSDIEYEKKVFKSYLKDINKFESIYN